MGTATARKANTEPPARDGAVLEQKARTNVVRLLGVGNGQTWSAAARRSDTFLRQGARRRRTPPEPPLHRGEPTADIEHDAPAMRPPAAGSGHFANNRSRHSTRHRTTR